MRRSPARQAGLCATPRPVHRKNLPLENTAQGAAECHRCNYDRDVPNTRKRATRTPRCTGWRQWMGPIPVEIQPWYEQAACLDKDADCFFPEKGGSTRAAKRICQTCTVQTECLEYALANDERFGIWGGLSERERRRLKRRAS